MQKHDFEKQVQEKLEELSLTPSAPVWQKVEEQIRKKKDKRRVIFWLLPLLVTGIAVVGYLLYHPAQLLTKANQSPVPSAAQSPSVRERHSNSTGYTTQKETVLRHQNSLPPSITSSQKLNTTSQKTVSHYSNRSTTFFVRKNNEQQWDNQEMKRNVYQTETTDHNSLAMNIRNEAVALIQISISKDSLLQINPLSNIKVTPKNTVVALDHSKEKKWQWNGFVYAGSSNVHNGLIGALNLDKSADSYNMNPVPVGSGTAGQGNYVLPPSPTTKGWALEAGVDVKRKISNRTFLTTGIHYAYYSTHISVGRKIPDSANGRQSSFYALSNYSNTNRINNYQNRYYFIEVPVVIDYQLLKQKPLYVHTGLSMTQLIKSHALRFDPTDNLYYQTSRFLNKTQINWLAAITYQFSLTKRLSLEAGPQIQYGFRALQQSYSQENQHLFSSGIRMNFSLK